MENSLSAFRRAAAEGYRYIETDVHTTRDGVVVVHHDPDLDRTTDGVGPIAEQSWAQVRRANIDGRESVCRLEDVLEELPDVSFNIDVKANDTVESLVQTIQRTGSVDRVGVASFSDSRISRVRRLAGPRLATALAPRATGLLRLSGTLRLPHPRRLVPGVMAQVPVAFGRFTVVDRAFLLAAARASVEVHTWTIDEPERMHALLDLGVDGIVTDRPDLLRDVLTERGGWQAGTLA